jgi:hypothetical protein
MKCKIFESSHVETRFEDLEPDINEFIEGKDVKMVKQTACFLRETEYGDVIHACITIWYED